MAGSGSRFSRIAGTVLSLVGALALALGMSAIVAYVWGVIDSLNQPDRSWIYWGLVFLFGGILMARGGRRLIAWGGVLRRS